MRPCFRSRRWIPLVCGLCAISCVSNLASRFEKGSKALSTGEGAAYFVRVGPILQDALNTCIPSSLPPPSPMIMVLADITNAGVASDVVVEPSSDGTRCVADQLSKAHFPPPPVVAGEETFPLGIRVDLAK